VLEFSDVALGMTGNCDGGIATGARMCADQFLGLPSCHDDFSALHPLLHAGDRHGFALGAYHCKTIVGFERGKILRSLNFVEHHLVLAALHRLHLVAGAGVCRAAARERQSARESQTEADFIEEVVVRFHSCVFLSGG